MFAVIDTETTGLSPKQLHRIAEIAVILVDESGAIEDSWSTLLNPDRDLGKQSIHGIKAADAAKAPRFEDIAGDLVDLLSGRILVAHNLFFDYNFVRYEFERMGVVFPIDYKTGGLCTMSLASQYLPGSGRSLKECCNATGIKLQGWHAALYDAQASAGLLHHYINCGLDSKLVQNKYESVRNATWPAIIKTGAAPYSRTEQEMAADTNNRQINAVARLTEFLPRIEDVPNADHYLAVLDVALEDRYLSADEIGALRTFAASLGLTEHTLSALHTGYFDALTRVAWSDGELTTEENNDLILIGSILDIPQLHIDAAIESAKNVSNTEVFATEILLEPGDHVVMTGDMEDPRYVWESRISKAGYVPHPSVTKKCKLVVAADVDSLSGKAKRARALEIPVVSVSEFEKYLGINDPNAKRSFDLEIGL